MVLLIILLILVDQITKYFLTSIINYGAAFGILQNQTLFLIIVSLLVIAACIYYYKKYKLPLSFILAGTISNLIDRIIFGYVRDFINLKIWPVFNLADTFNCIGVALIIYFLIKKPKNQ